MYGRVALIFLHGSGGCGSDTRGFLESLPIPQYQYNTFREVLDSLSVTLFTPTAQVRRYSAAGGERMNVWFDRSPRYQMEGMSSTEDLQGVEVSMNSLASMIRGMEEEEPFDHYILGGFSMGGGLSLHALRKQITPKLRGIFCLSSFAPHGSAILTELSLAAKSLPVMMMHGDDDTLIPCEWGRQTSTNFHMKELKVQFCTYPHLDHDMSEDELSDLLDWIKVILSSSLSAEKRTLLRGKALEGKYDDMTMELKEAEEELHRFEHRELGAESKATSGNPAESKGMQSKVAGSSSTSSSAAKRTADDDMLPYTIEYNPASRDAITPQVIIRFTISPDYIPVLTSRPIFACGSTFDILPDSPNGVKTIAYSSDPHKTAGEISKRLYIRLTSGSSNLNPCTPS